MSTEADTCRRYVLPKLIAAGWDDDPHSFTEQRTFTDGRIVVAGTTVTRRPQKRADYLLRYTRDFTIAVVEGSPTGSCPATGSSRPRSTPSTGRRSSRCRTCGTYRRPRSGNVWDVVGSFGGVQAMRATVN